MKDYYVGLDIGTNSVGWAVTDEQYRLCKYRKKTMWGIRLFEDANTAADRRMKRAARRRLQRKKQRIDLLQELFAEEMVKADETFFLRLNASRLKTEDKGERLLEKSRSLSDASRIRHPLFIGEAYSDIEYYREYPTIYHLRKELMENPAPHDIRLVYLALHHILKSRGHFLVEGTLGEAKDLGIVLEQFIVSVRDELELEIQISNPEEVEEILRDQAIPNSAKAKHLAGCFRPEDSSEDTKEELKRKKTVIENICKLIAGNKGDIAKIFGETGEMEKTSFSFSEASYEERRAELEDALPEKCYLIDKIKSVYDWSVLANVLDGEEYLSNAKVRQFETHKKNLDRLHRLMRKYCSKEVRDGFFDGPKNSKDRKGVSYANYIGASKTNGKKSAWKRCAEEDFYKELLKILSGITPEEGNPADRAELEELMKGAGNKTLLPLQRSKDNGAVPHQVHEAELKRILANAEGYLPFLKETDESGMSVSQKVETLLRFRIPYYVGPLSDRHKEQGSNAWIVRRPGQNGRIYPWNFDRIVDLESSNKAFIRRMTNKCTYLLGEDVIPKNSLLYSRFMVLNELNNLRIRGEKITVSQKQEIFRELFMSGSRVTGAKLLQYLRREDSELKKEDLSGFDQDFKANLSSYLDFEKQVFGERMAEDSVRKLVEEVIEWKTIYGDDDKMVRTMLEQTYPEEYRNLSETQKKMIARFRYSGWGNFSEKFLRGVEGTDKETGEVFTIIEALWETNCNLMQLLSSRFTFRKEIEDYNAEQSGEITQISYDALIKDLYVSPANKRAIWQTVQIAEEIKKVMGGAPRRIFVEMARGGEKEKKRTTSRKQQLLDLYAACEKDTRDWRKEIEERDEREFSSMKLFLYYTQMGRCMYTGNPIDVHELMAGNPKWDRDHIYPQSRIKDDSIDNLVLVEKAFNAKKSNELLSADIQMKQKDRWRMLLQKGFISRKKYDRLTRRESFSEEELAGFIERQLVETRQSSKAAAELLKRLYPETEIVYVKAGLASQLRRESNVLKSRRANDYHHAKDAYFNIVAGNVYNAKFTSDPRKWIQNKMKQDSGKLSYNLGRVFDFDVMRGETCVWKGPELDERKKAKLNENGEKYGGTMDLVRATARQNDVLYTEYTYCEKGQLFNETLAGKADGAKIPLKTGLDPEKYGGYTSAATSYFALIEFDGKKGERVRNIMEVPIYIANMLEHDPDAYKKYLAEIKELRNVTILRPCMKKNSLLRIDGYPMRIRGISGSRDLLFKNNLQPVWGEHEETIRRIEKFLGKDNDFEVDEARDGLSPEKLLTLYDLMIEKLQTVYGKRPANQGKQLLEYRENFEGLTLREQAKVLDQMLAMLRCDNATTANIAAIGGGSAVGNMAENKNTIGKKKIILINQSVTGLFENRIEL